MISAVKTIGQTRWKSRFDELKTFQERSLEHKVQVCEELLSHILETHERPVIAWSGGKDSTVLLHMALKQARDLDVVWVNTGVEFPECVRFIFELKRLWQVNLHVARPDSTFWKVVEEYGWPMLGKGGNGGWQSRADYLERSGKAKLAKATREAKISAACCRILKHSPANKIYRQLQADCIILGNMVSESQQRFFTWSQRGDYYYAISESRYKVWPLSTWKDSDIWEYHKEYEIPYSKIYDMGHKRNGCWPCLMDIKFSDSKLSILRQSHPKLWRFLLVDKGLAERILKLKLALEDEEASDHESWLQGRIESLVAQRPCFFDSV